MEGQAVIEALADQLLEILTGDGGDFLIQLNVDDAAVFHSNANHSFNNAPFIIARFGVGAADALPKLPL